MRWKPKRFFIVLAALAGISAVYLIYIRSFGHLSRLVDYVGIFATFSTVMIITIFPPALLADRLARNVSKQYRTWVWLAVAIVLTSTVWLVTYLAWRRFATLR